MSKYQGIGSENSTPKSEEKKVAFDIPVLPRDEEGFVQSFSVDQVPEYLEFFDKYGLVVIRDVLDADQIASGVDDIWESCILKDTRVKRDDPETWNKSHGWPSLDHVGILGGSVAVNRTAFENRQSEKVYSVFSKLLKTDDLQVSHDRYGVMRPTRNVLLKNGATKNLMHYQTISSWMHWDLNPWTYSSSSGPFTVEDKELNVEDIDEYFICENNGTLANYHKLQGLVTLTESTDADGGFLAVPGFNHLIKDWAEANIKTKIAGGDFVNVPKSDPLTNQGQNITARAGSLIVWSSTLPHCNYPNKSDRFRIVQYIKMFPKNQDTPKFNESRKRLVEIILNEFEPSDLGKQLML